MPRGGRGGRPGRPTNAAEKRGTAASTSWWKPGAATTGASMRKAGRIGLDGGGCSFGHNLTRCTKASESEAEGSLVNVARADTVDTELDRLICKRASQDRRPDPDEQEEMWKASVRAYNARHQEEMRAAWCEYHRGQAARHRAVLEKLIARHEEKARRLLAD